MSKMLDDLARSGITQEEANKLGFVEIPTAGMKDVIDTEQAGYKIPYYDVRGKDTGFFRIRFTEFPMSFNNKPQRYSQPAGALPRFYLPTLENWQLHTNSSTPLYITEGEKKAAVGCKYGLPTIGLGGVWSWKSAKRAKPAIDDFEEFTWCARNIYLVFDSDVVRKPQVQHALMSLCDELTGRGALPYIVMLPDDDDKCGLDDYLLEHGVDEFHDLPTEDFSKARELWALNQEYAVIENPPSILDIQSQQLTSNNKFTEILAADRFYYEVKPSKSEKGRPQLIKLPAAKEWLRWSKRRKHKKITYAPGKPEILEDTSFNLWHKSGPEPREPQPGELDLYYRLRDHIFKCSPESIDWFESWVAYPIQNPGTKLYTAVLVQGLKHGTGKSLLGMTIGRLYGENFINIGHDQIYQPFNEWAVNRQFVLGDEITGSDRRRDSDLLKALITREQLEINVKYGQKYYLPDCINYYFTSNHPDAVYLDDDDRRYFILETPTSVLDEQFYVEFDKWYRSDGLGSLLFYFKNKDLSNFNPRAHAPSTAAKKKMVAIGRSSIDDFAAQLAKDPEPILAVGSQRVEGDIFQAKDLLPLYDSDAHKSKEVSLSRALVKSGVPIRIIERTGQKLFLLRNSHLWNSAGDAELLSHYNKVRGNNVVKQVKF